VEAVRVSAVKSSALVVGLPVAICVGGGTPVQGTRDDVVAALGVGVVVTSALHDINLPGLRPRAVRVVDGQHPDCRPEPLTGREFSIDFNAAVLDGGAFAGVDAARADGLDDGAVGGVGGGDALGPGCAGAGACFEEVDGVVGGDQAGVLEGGLDDEGVALHEDVFVCVCGFFEFAVTRRMLLVLFHSRRVSSRINVPESADFDFLGPDVHVQSSAAKVVRVYRAIVEVGYTPHTIPNEDTCNSKPGDYSNDGNPLDPFLFPVLLLRPRLLDCAFLNSS